MKQIMSLYPCEENKLDSDMVRNGSATSSILSSVSYFGGVYSIMQRLSECLNVHQSVGDGFRHSQQFDQFYQQCSAQPIDFP